MNLLLKSLFSLKLKSLSLNLIINKSCFKAFSLKFCSHFLPGLFTTIHPLKKIITILIIIKNNEKEGRKARNSLSCSPSCFVILNYCVSSSHHNHHNYDCACLCSSFYWPNGCLVSENLPKKYYQNSFSFP